MKTNSTKAHPTYLKLIRKWLSLGLLSTLGSSAFAATLTWTTGDGGDGLWSNTANWGGATFASGDSAIFGSTTGTTTMNNDLATTFRVASFTFNADAPAYTIGGNAFAPTSGGTSFVINSASNITQTINNNFTLHQNNVDVTGPGNLTLGGSITKGGTWNPYLVMNGTGVLTLNGATTMNLLGSGNAYQFNSGTVVLAKSVAGAFNPAGVTINGSTVKLGAADQLRSGTALTINGGTLDLNGFDSQTTAAPPSLVSAPSLNGTGGLITNNAAGSGTNLIVFGLTNNTSSYGGTISDGTTAKVGVTVNNAGPNPNFMVLSGRNNYSGGTIIKSQSTADRATTFSIADVGNIGSSGNRSLTFIGNSPAAETLLQLTGTAVTNSNQFDTLAFTSGKGVGFDVADPTNVFTLGKNSSNVDIAISGAGNFQKRGAGTLLVTSGSVAYTGATVLLGGTLKIDAQPGGVLASTSVLGLGGGDLYLLGKTSGTTTQTLGNVTLGLKNFNYAGIGASKITVDANGGGGTTLALSTLADSTQSGSTLNIKITTGGQVSTTTTSTTNGLIGNGRVVFTDASNNVDFASIPGSGIRYIQAASYTGGTLPTSGSTSTLNYSHTDNASVTASESVNALKLTTTTTGQSLAITSTETLTLTTGGLLFTGANDYSISGGTLKSNTTTDSDLIIHHYGAGNLTIGSVIANGIGASTLTKVGTGTLVLSGANTYTGLTMVNGGTLSISSDSNIGGTNGTFGNLTSLTTSSSVTYTGSLPTGFSVGSAMLGRTVTAINTGTSTITLSGNANTALSGGTASWAFVGIGTSGNASFNYGSSHLWLNSGGVLQATSSFSLSQTNGTTTANRAVTIGTGGGGFDVTGSNTLTVPGSISATGMMSKSGTGVLVLSGSNSLVGGLTINDGTVQQGIANALGSVATSNLIFGSGTAPKLQLNNFDAKVTSLVSSNANAIVENGSGTSGTKTLTVYNGADNTYAGILRNGSTGLLALAKSGGGTLSLTNAGNIFTGGITIYNGILEGTQTGSLGSGAITLADGTLKAAGSFSNAIGSSVNFTNNTALTASYLNNTIDTNSGSASFSGALSGSGALKKTGANTLTLSHATNTYTGTLTASAGTVSFASMGATAGLVLGGGNFTSTGTTTVASLAVNSSGGTVTASANSLTVNSLTGSSNFSAIGTQYGPYVRLLGTNTGFSGGITAVGNFVLGSEAALGTNTDALTLNGALTDNGSGLTIASHRIILSSGQPTLNGNMNLTGGLTGTGGITVRSATAGAIVIGGTTNDFAGGVNVYTDNGNHSTLRMSAPNALPSGTGNGNLHLTAWSTGNAILDLNGNGQTVNGLLSSGTNAATRTIIDNVTAGGNVTLTVGAGNATGNTFSGIIKNTTGTLNLTKTGTGTQSFSGANTYTGTTTINEGTLSLSGSGSLSDLTAVVVNSPGSFDISGLFNSEKIASLSGAGGSTLKLGANVLEFGDANDTSFAGAVESSTGGGVKKVGTGVFTLGALSYAGTGLSINISQGSLLTSANNLPSSTAFTLSGGSLNTGAFSNTVGSLSVTSGSVIDFAGGGTPVLTFANQGAWSGLLQVWNWSGSVWSSGTGGQLRFADGIDGTLVDGSKIQFYSGAGTGLIGEGGAFIGTQLVPIPEPTTIVSSLLLLGVIGFQRRRKSASEYDAS